MADDDVMQIKVDTFTVGIIGLKAVMEEMAREFADKPDEEIQSELLKRLSRRNYISNKAKDGYAKAFLREFRKFLGRPYEEGISGGLEIKVLGAGCPQCDKLEQQLMAVVAETGILADIDHVRDIKEIAKHGVFGTPAVVIDGKVKSVGKIPSRDEIKSWLCK
ncbi:MAG: thioredoxin family protein [Desulfobacteraceae bacterium]